MIEVAESVYNDTWGGGPLPGEIIDFELMSQMRWSWQDLESTPPYVKRYTWDLLQIRNEAERNAMQ